MRPMTRWMAALALALPTAAAAQTLDPASLREVDDDDATAAYEGRSVDELEDMDVVRDGERIGEVEEVLADAQDRIVAVVVEYDDGFLDLGETEVVLPVDQLQFDEGADEVTISLADDELRALPVWDD